MSLKRTRLENEEDDAVEFQQHRGSNNEDNNNNNNNNYGHPVTSLAAASTATAPATASSGSGSAARKKPHSYQFRNPTELEGKQGLIQRFNQSHSNAPDPNVDVHTYHFCCVHGHLDQKTSRLSCARGSRDPKLWPNAENDCKIVRVKVQFDEKREHIEFVNEALVQEKMNHDERISNNVATGNFY